MLNILSSEHCSRITTWDGKRAEIQKSKKRSNRLRLLFFVGFNAAAWTLLLAFLFSA